MLRGPLYRDGYHPQLSGHETFPIRYGWLKKAYDAVRDTEGEEDNRYVFTGPEAIARFGVGKNMAASMRHWAHVAGIVDDSLSQKRIRTTSLGHLIFGESGLDPYMEHPATAWLVHWQLSGRDTKTTWYWAFNYFPSVTFDRESLVEGMRMLAEERKWTRASLATIRRDVSCFVRTYVGIGPSGSDVYEDSLESPLIELGLIKPTGRRDGFRYVRGSKPSLGTGVFGYAVTDFWNSSFKNSNTLSFEALAHEPGSPGRAFLLEENDMVDMLVALDDSTSGVYRWSETAGLKQLIRSRTISVEESLEIVRRDYRSDQRGEAIHAFG